MLAALKATKDTVALGEIVSFVAFRDDHWLIACPYSHRAVCDVMAIRWQTQSYIARVENPKLRLRLTAPCRLGG